jgi:hypothetical protein
MFRLALSMGCTIRELEARMNSREFSEWMAYYGIEPWGEERGDLRVAMLTSLTANINRRKGSKPLRPVDFMPYHERDEKKDETTDLKDFLRRKSGKGR